MPALLKNAYGDTWFSQANVGNARWSSTRTASERLGTADPDTEYLNSDDIVELSKMDRPAANKKQNYVIKINISIDQHDCHLICLFLGVFILSVLFTRK